MKTGKMIGQNWEWEFESLKHKEKLSRKFIVVLLCNSNNWKPEALLEGDWR